MDEEVRHTDYGDDTQDVESHAASARFNPYTGERLKRAAIIVAIVFAIAFVLVSIDRFIKARSVARAAQEAAAAPPLVDVITAQAVGAVQRLMLPGYTAAWHASTIYARVDGYVGKWFVDIGDRVHAGQVLALIETPDLDAELAAARAQLKADQATVVVRRAETEFARTTYDRWRDSPKGVVSEQEREEKKAAYDSAVARQRSAEADVALAQAGVDKYQALSQFKKVTAPYDGVITVRDIDIGNLVTAGSTSSTTSLYVMTQNDPMRIFVDAPQSAADDLINNKAPVQVQTSAGVMRDYSGRVTRTSQALNPQARTLRVEVDIPNPKDEFVPGMYVKVGFGLPPRGLVQVPAAALVFRASGPQVARVDSSGRISFRTVTIGRDDGSVIELSSGIAPGDRLALNVSSRITDGELVRAHGVEADKAAPVAKAER
ncbi:MAG TPA: efflux RND transporter periplasmic adaptor subunit [Steroidobacteraceae bacterium]|jgi:RND family efflux transporter MFP subunit|nr:efflux RND transporter periplasmic adaptor subunit [Steroidobacteraceae bacterium]